ncbi:MAG: hypothetical protein OIF35_02615, partial [Cellvibrionaceae bacterium]|nr:hypothetical protein [Cellvibrionaceae bacterium]
MDCHVLFPPGALAALLDYFSSRPDCNDLIQGPLLHDDNKTVSTHLNFKWVNGMWGDWDKDERGFDPAAPAFEIMSQGCGVFAARKASWPGFNPRARGFGAEEGYIQEKFRQAGQRALCLPALRWLHRFGRPLGPPYKINWADRIRNYMIGWVELGLDTEAIREHFSEQLNAATVDEIIAAIELEMASPLFAIDMVCTLVKPADRQQFEQYQLHQRMVDHSEVGSDLDLRWQTLAHFLRQQSLGNSRHCLIIQDPQNLNCLLQAPELKALSEDRGFTLWLSPNQAADDRLSNTNLLIEQRLFTAVADYLEQAASLSSAELSRETLLQKLGLSTSEPQ